MTTLLNNPTTRPAYITWSLLIAATITSWVLGSDHGLDGDQRDLVAGVILALTFVKIDLVGRYFMELHGAPPLLRRAFSAWAVGTFVVCFVLYLSI